jgi:hypothetical protein
MRIKNMSGLHFYRLSSISHLQIRVRRCSAQPQVLDGIADGFTAGMDEASVLTCRRSNEKQNPISHENRPNQRAGFD